MQVTNNPTESIDAMQANVLDSLYENLQRNKVNLAKNAEAARLLATVGIHVDSISLVANPDIVVDTLENIRKCRQLFGELKMSGKTLAEYYRYDDDADWVAVRMRPVDTQWNFDLVYYEQLKDGDPCHVEEEIITQRNLVCEVE